MPVPPEEIASDVARSYEHATDADPLGRLRARNILGGVLEDLCHPAEFDVTNTFLAMTAVETQCHEALVWFSAQLVVELHSMGWDADEAHARWAVQTRGDAQAKAVRVRLAQQAHRNPGAN
jgi:hypothetical protein